MTGERINTAEQQKLRDDLAVFVLSLVQALLRTGSFAPEQPASSREKTELYENFTGLVENGEEIAFVKFVQPDRTDVLVEGVLDSQFSLRSEMQGGTAELFIPRFIEYVVRSNLAEFSIKQGISREAFDAFLELMGTPLPDRDESSGGFTDELRQRNITHVSVVFDTDLAGALKTLPWRVKLALARFVKDAALMPVFKGGSAETAAETQKKIVQAVVRPLQDPALLKDILLYSDIAASSMQGGDTGDLDQTIVSVLPGPLVIRAGGLLLKEYGALNANKTEKKNDAYERKASGYTTGLGAIAARLIQDDDPDGDGLLREIHGKKIIADAVLPERVKRKVKVSEFAARIAAEPKQYMNRMLDAAPVEGEIGVAGMAALSLPELLKHNNFGLVSDIAGILAKNKTTSQSVRKAIVLLETRELLDELEQMLATAGPETANGILDVYRLAGRNAVPHLVKVLLDIENSSIRHRIINALIEMKEFAEPVLLQELRNKEHPWFMLRNMIYILGEIRSQTAPELFSELWQHEHPRVREEILSSTYKIFGKDGEGVFIEALDDKDYDVRKKAIYCLGMVRSTDRNVILGLINIIKKRPSGDRELPDNLQEQAAVSLGLIGNQSKDFHDVIEQSLIGAVTPEHKGLLGIGKTGMQEKTDAVRIAVCGALAIMGSAKAVVVLEKLAGAKDSALTKAAADAIGKIKSSAGD